ncbi:hypothetical protein ACLOJK_037265, partial [Asimina triloba]
GEDAAGRGERTASVGRGGELLDLMREAADELEEDGSGERGVMERGQRMVDEGGVGWLQGGGRADGLAMLACCHRRSHGSGGEIEFLQFVIANGSFGHAAGRLGHAVMETGRSPTG